MSGCIYVVLMLCFHVVIMQVNYSCKDVIMQMNYVFLIKEKKKKEKFEDNKKFERVKEGSKSRLGN